MEEMGEGGGEGGEGEGGEREEREREREGYVINPTTHVATNTPS